jgi:hypothetical protein
MESDIAIGNEHELEPYRLQWRATGVTNWLNLESSPDEDTALARMATQHNRLGGQIRIVYQHVTDATGLREPMPYVYPGAR